MVKEYQCVILWCSPKGLSSLLAATLLHCSQIFIHMIIYIYVYSIYATYMCIYNTTNKLHIYVYIHLYTHMGTKSTFKGTMMA